MFKGHIFLGWICVMWYSHKIDGNDYALCLILNCCVLWSSCILVLGFFFFLPPFLWEMIEKFAVSFFLLFTKWKVFGFSQIYLSGYEFHPSYFVVLHLLLINSIFNFLLACFFFIFTMFLPYRSFIITITILTYRFSCLEHFVVVPYDRCCGAFPF